VHGVGVDAVGEVGADGARSGFLGVGGAHQVAVFGDRALAFEHLDHHRTRDHEVHQVFEEGACAVHIVELLGLGARKLHQLGRHNLEPSGFEAAGDLADHVFGNGVGFDDGEGALESHGMS